MEKKNPTIVVQSLHYVFARGGSLDCDCGTDIQWYPIDAGHASVTASNGQHTDCSMDIHHMVWDFLAAHGIPIPCVHGRTWMLWHISILTRAQKTQSKCVQRLQPKRKESCKCTCDSGQVSSRPLTKQPQTPWP